MSRQWHVYGQDKRIALRDFKVNRETLAFSLILFYDRFLRGDITECEEVAFLAGVGACLPTIFKDRRIEN